MSEHNNLGEYLASLNRCWYCGRIISGEICQDETGEMCDGEKRFEDDIYAQQIHEQEMEEELEERYNQLRWDEYREQQENQ